ncbi:succinylglutamate desuccinylase [Arenicella chitinivorans]|uniref:Succinylglutamate desuccinylase n=1 Tax=Arenicella chitinivorans TaxID=1329800 RepID=A0A918VID1_9GAMM|nr:succinylglutamate desuccinylase [Arenicella chitinivorans]GGZ98596.1 succinylglutamate desuccinylase [Arenicella chitinivorans]
MNSSVSTQRFLARTLAAPESPTSLTETLADGTRLTLLDAGVLRISPTQPGSHRALISCGVHGNETAPMEIVDQLVSDIFNGQLKVNNELMFVIGNPPAAIAEQRFVEENLNRLFSGKHRHSTAKEAARAARLEALTEAFFLDGDEPRLHYDLHTAIRGSYIEKFAVYPYLHSRTWSESQFGFLEQAGIEAVLLSNQPSGTYSYFSSHEFGADAFTIELGKVRKFGDNDMRRFAQMTESLRRVVDGTERFVARRQAIKIFAVVEEVIKRSENFKLHIPDEAKNFTEYDAGALLASDDDYEYRTQRDGERFVFPITNVPPGQRAMLVVAPVTDLTELTEA